MAEDVPRQQQQLTNVYNSRVCRLWGVELKDGDALSKEAVCAVGKLGRGLWGGGGLGSCLCITSVRCCK